MSATATEASATYDTPYDLRPEKTENCGKLLWVSGASGSGKSTVAKKLKETGDYVFYEGDCFMFHMNPYPNDKAAAEEKAAANAEEAAADENAAAKPQGFDRDGKDWNPDTMAADVAAIQLSSSTVGIPEATVEACRRVMSEGYMKIGEGQEVEFSVWENFYKLLCADVIAERERLGPGWNFVVAQAVYTRQARDLIRTLLGPDLKFVVLDVDKVLQSERMASRFNMPPEAAPGLLKYCNGFEAATEDETSTLGLSVGHETTQEHVAQAVLAFMNQ